MTQQIGDDVPTLRARPGVRTEPGDSVRFAGEGCAWRNEGAGPAVAIWVAAPPVC